MDNNQFNNTSFDFEEPDPNQSSFTDFEPQSEPSKKKSKKTYNSGNTGKKSNPKTGKGKKEKIDFSVKRSDKKVHRILPYVFDFLALFFLVVLFLDLFCNPDGTIDPNAHWMGSFGYYVSLGINGVFGLSSYVIPFVLLWMGLQWQKEVNRGRDILLSVSAFLTPFFIGGVIEVIHIYNECTAKASSFGALKLPFSVMFKSGWHKIGGGCLPGKMGWFLCKYMNVPGSLILLFVLLIVDIFLLIGITPKHLLLKIRYGREIRKKSPTSQSETEAEQAENKIKTEERMQRVAHREVTVANEQDILPEDESATDRNGNPNVSRALTVREEKKLIRNAEKERKEQAKKKAEEEKIAPIPLPHLSPTDGEKLFVPSQVTTALAKEKPASPSEEDDYIPPKMPEEPKPAPTPEPVPVRKKENPETVFPKTAGKRVLRKYSIKNGNFDLADIFNGTTAKKPVENVANFEQNSSKTDEKTTHQEAPNDRQTPPQPIPVQTTNPKTSDATQFFHKSTDDELRSENVSDEELQRETDARFNTEEQKAIDSELNGNDQISMITSNEFGIMSSKSELKGRFYFPPMTDEYLHPMDPETTENQEEVNQSLRKIAQTFESFKVGIASISYSWGPTVTRYEITPAIGVHVSKIYNAERDLAMVLATDSLRMYQIPDRSAIAVEVPNKVKRNVYLRETMEGKGFKDGKDRMLFGLGKNVAGQPVYCAIPKMPHLLIAGTTNSGKSVCINSIIISLLYRLRPSELRMILIDPKQVEFNVYRDIPHLLCPVITKKEMSAGALQAACKEMDLRYKLCADVGARNITEYNKKTEDDPNMPFMPFLMVVIDELAELMLSNVGGEVEEALQRLLQLGRAAGIHVIIGTQRPSVDVITGILKSNLPSRIAFAVSSQIDSRVILDNVGAEQLLGRGDMLYSPIGSRKPIRVQGSFVDGDEVERICNYLIEKNGKARYDDNFATAVSDLASQCGVKGKASAKEEVEDMSTASEEAQYTKALQIAISEGTISTSLLGRRMSIGYNKSARFLDRMLEEGLISPPNGSKPRQVYITADQFNERLSNGIYISKQ